MLFVLFRLGNDRYVMPASRVVEVVPLMALKRLPQAPPGLAGILNYRGRPVPVVDLCELALGHPASEQLSTRILITHHWDAAGENRLLGLVAEHATEILRKEAQDFAETGVHLGAAPYLGPVWMDPQGPVQWIDEQRLLPEPVRDLIFAETVNAES
jgi:chemotaxis-related protein WspB